MADDKKQAHDDTQGVYYGWGSVASDDNIIVEDLWCCSGWHCHDDDDDCCRWGWGCCHDDDDDAQWGCCGWGCGGHQVHLTVEQIAQVNEILWDIDDEDLASGNYDLSDEDLERLRGIFG